MGVRGWPLSRSQICSLVPFGLNTAFPALHRRRPVRPPQRGQGASYLLRRSVRRCQRPAPVDVDLPDGGREGLALVEIPDFVVGAVRVEYGLPGPSAPDNFNAAGCSSSTTALFQNVKSGWTFTAKGVIQYVDGTIEWDHSSDGCFKEVERRG